MSRFPIEFVLQGSSAISNQPLAGHLRKSIYDPVH